MSLNPRLISARLLCLALLFPVFLVACATNEAQGPILSQQGQPSQTRPQETSSEVLPPAYQPSPWLGGKLLMPHMQGRDVVRIALLLPFSAKNSGVRAQANSMLDAAQMAVIEGGDLRLVLIPKDTGGTRNGAVEAARSAIADGADIFVGPLLSAAVSGVSEEARRANIPVIAFSTDVSVAGDGVYLLNFRPEIEVARIISYSVMQGHNTFALLRNKSKYGDRVESSMQIQTLINGAELKDIAVYPGENGQKNAPIAELAHAEEREELLQIWREEGGVGDPALDPEFVFELPYSAVLIAEGGLRLQSLAPLLPYYDVDPRKTRFLGTGQWFDEKLNREPALNGGWFVGPAKSSIDAFRASFIRVFGEKPLRLAPLTYDAVRTAAAITEITADGTVYIRIDELERRQGFAGATGLFRFSADGLAEHSLAVYQMRKGRFEVLDPAPVAFELEGF